MESLRDDGVTKMAYKNGIPIARSNMKVLTEKMYDNELIELFDELKALFGITKENDEDA